MKSLLLIATLQMLALVAANDPKPARIGGKRTLILAENSEIETSHSMYIDSLKGMNHS